jgi:hypothetical protein
MVPRQQQQPSLDDLDGPVRPSQLQPATSLQEGPQRTPAAFGIYERDATVLLNSSSKSLRENTRLKSPASLRIPSHLLIQSFCGHLHSISPPSRAYLKNGTTNNVGLLRNENPTLDFSKMTL